MVTDRQIRRLMSLLQAGQSQQVSADKAGMDRGTARKYRQSGQLPSALRKDHAWRTRRDPFAGVWPWVVEQLSLNPGLEAKTLLEALQRAHPGDFADGQLRTLQRQVKRWRGLEGPGKEVFFAQVHRPGRLCQSDFSHMTKLAVTIAGQTLEHLIYHFVLTYSNWEAFTLCYSESFESLSEGLQNALWELGGVPQRHRTDRLGAAVANGRDMKEFTARYQGLLAHYDLQAEKTNPDSGHENGDVEQRHHRFKRAVDQALMLRGNRTARGLMFNIHTQQVELDPTPGEDLGRLDLAFSPPVPREDICFCVECKRLNVVVNGQTRAYAAEYVNLGMLRFVTGQYARAVRHGGMLAYVLDGDVTRAVSNIEGSLRTHHVVLCMTAPGAFQPSSVVSNDSRVKETHHRRAHHTMLFRIQHVFVAR